MPAPLPARSRRPVSLRLLPYHMALSGGVAHNKRLALWVNKADWPGVVGPWPPGAASLAGIVIASECIRVHESTIAVTQVDISDLMVEKRADATFIRIVTQ